MGIPGLTARLSGRGSVVTMAYPAKSVPAASRLPTHPHDALIVDGPGLAYHVYKEVQAIHASAGDAIPSPLYHACGARAIAFLNEMEKVGLRLEAVYFDGVLPGHKLDTRISRMQKHVDQLRKAVLSDVNVARLPDAPFLVPAVIEALLASEYASIVQVVPAEADDYCAVHARILGKAGVSRALIMTNDSDMFVLDCGRHTHVLLLASLSRKTTPYGFQYTAEMYCPGDIAQSAGLPDLRQAAYYMELDRNLTFDAAAAKIRRLGGTAPEKYASFSKRLGTSDVSLSSLSPAIITCLQRMDPRIAEVAHQIVLPDLQAEPNLVKAFLPLLHEDATRFSVWKIGLDIRDVAYRVVLSPESADCVVHEYTRRGAGVGHSLLNRTADWADELSEVMAWLIASLSQAPLAASSAQRWHYTGTFMALQFYNEYYAQPVPYARVLTVLMRDQPRDWFDVHIAGMTQAAIYSMRMLKRLLDLHAVRRGVTGDLARLQGVLGDMPGIAELFERSETDTVAFWKLSAEKSMAMLAPVEGTSDDEMADSDEGSDDAAAIGSNPFSVLAR